MYLIKLIIAKIKCSILGYKLYVEYLSLPKSLVIKIIEKYISYIIENAEKDRNYCSIWLNQLYFGKAYNFRLLKIIRYLELYIKYDYKIRDCDFLIKKQICLYINECIICFNLYNCFTNNELELNSYEVDVL